MPEQEAVSIPLRLTVPECGFVRAMLSHTESPSRFWIHVVDENAWKTDFVGDELSKHYAEWMNIVNSELRWLLESDRILQECSIVRCSDDDKLCCAEVVNGCIRPTDSVIVSEELVKLGFAIRLTDAEPVRKSSASQPERLQPTKEQAASPSSRNTDDYLTASSTDDGMYLI
jgi:hypothetical protein